MTCSIFLTERSHREPVTAFAVETCLWQDPSGGQRVWQTKGIFDTLSEASNVMDSIIAGDPRRRHRIVLALDETTAQN